jgi:hypothetical protein
MNRPDVKVRLSVALKGKPLTEEHKKKLMESHRGYKHTPQHRENIRIAMNRPEVKARISAAFKGIPLTEEHKKKLRLRKRWRHTPEARAKISAAKKGILHPAWRGGVSFEPYCPKFNEEFKERIRNFFRRRCVLCKLLEEENGCRLHVHHVNYYKMTCCDNTAPMFAALCHSCHSWTNHHREEAESKLTEIINQQYDGKSYLLPITLP